MKENNVNENGKMAMTAKGIRLLLAGLVVIVSGYILMMGGGSDDPQVFNYAMFDFRRLVAAPIVIIAGLVIEVVAIMKVFK
jgi:hypothetical protein